MKVTRKIEVDSDGFYIGDIINFELNDGEEVQAMAVKQTDKGMLFVLMDCLAKEYPMFNSLEDMTDDFFAYENSDLRKALNEEILTRFPEEIRSRMIALDNGDMLRIPDEREIFDENFSWKEKSKIVKQWEPMKETKNRIAFRGKEGAWEWYWLMNLHNPDSEIKEYASVFSRVDPHGFISCAIASYHYGVRPVFLLR